MLHSCFIFDWLYLLIVFIFCRYLQRVVAHPSLLQDPDVREFLERDEVTTFIMFLDTLYSIFSGIFKIETCVCVCLVAQGSKYSDFEWTWPAKDDKQSVGRSK